MITLKLQICFILTATFVFLHPAHTSAQAASIRQAGSGLKLEDAVKKADLILTATLQNLGGTTPSAPGRVVYSAATINPINMLKGAHNNGAIRVAIIVRSAKDDLGNIVDEATPEVGKDYVCFISVKPDTGDKTMLKMLPSDAVTLAAVSAAMSALPQ